MHWIECFEDDSVFGISLLILGIQIDTRKLIPRSILIHDCMCFVMMLDVDV